MQKITIDTLKKLFEKECKAYRTAEIGSGVQMFCKKVFQCPDLFNLKAGILSKQISTRKNEFLEEASKKGRRADVVIFIDSDIIIPVEVERTGNIKAGIKQLFNYQADWVKKYGILTDGNEWRFYNNTIIDRTFYIEDILNNPAEFLTFWKEYITPKYYYQSFFEKKAKQELLEDIPNLDDVREDFFTDITTLIENFENKLNLKGYFKEVDDETEQKKKAVEITYAYLIQFILYKTLVDNGFVDFETDWKQRINSIGKAIKNESYAETISKINGISKKISDNIYKLFNDEQKNINKKLNELLEKPKNEITDVSVWLDILLFISRYNFCNVKNEIFGYIYENYLKQLSNRDKKIKKGQYFTDPYVVDFMLDQIGYNSNELKEKYKNNKNSISIIDPSCGSGTFLYNATTRIVETFFNNDAKSSKLTEEIINENIFGLDIGNFPLYLAEMNILMRLLPVIINENYNNPVEQKLKIFKTRDSISEFMDSSLRNTLADANVDYQKSNGQMELFTEMLDLGYDSHLRNKRDLNEVKNSLENQPKIPRSRFDYVIGNPPYLSYKECTTQNLLFYQLQKKGAIKMSDIYGINLHSVSGHEKKYAPTPNLFAYFIALGLALLKDNGKFSFIIPQTLLVSSALDVLRYHLSKFVTIEKIINFAGPMFIGRGIKQNKPVNTSSLIFVIKKATPSLINNVEIINYNGKSKNVENVIDEIKNSKKVKKFTIGQNQLLKKFKNWNFILQNKKFLDFYDSYLNKSDSLYNYYQHDFAIRCFGNKFYFDRGLKYPKECIQHNSGDFNIPSMKKNNYYSKKSCNYIDVKNIVFPHGSQGIDVYKQKYKILWSYHYFKDDCFKYADYDVMIDYNHVLISSNCKSEILYLLSIFNSPISIKIIESFFRIPNEKDVLIGIKSIKNFIRIPKIDNKNEKIKQKIIEYTEKLIDCEKKTVGDVIDFKGVLLQKFDSVEIQENSLVICYNNNSVKCKILADLNFIKSALTDQLDSIIDENGIGNIDKLKKLFIIDFELQKDIKNYIDNLIFSLYFNVKLLDNNFNNRNEIRKQCENHKYFNLINE